AVNYGVPQMRERFFLIAVHGEVSNAIKFPLPTHKAALPSGYQSSRTVALRPLFSHPLYLGKSLYVASPSPTPTALPAVTVEEALGDLPPIMGHLDGSLRRGARRFDMAVTYRTGAE